MMEMVEEHVKPTEAQLKARRSRSLAIALALAAFVIIVYVGSMARLGSHILAGRM